MWVAMNMGEWREFKALRQYTPLRNATLISSGGSHYAGYGIAGQTLTFAAGLTQQGNISIYDSSVATVINNGTLNFNVAGTSVIQPTTFTNNGTLSC